MAEESVVVRDDHALVRTLERLLWSANDPVKFTRFDAGAGASVAISILTNWRGSSVVLMDVSRVRFEHGASPRPWLLVLQPFRMVFKSKPSSRRIASWFQPIPTSRIRSTLEPRVRAMARCSMVLRISKRSADIISAGLFQSRP